MLANCTPMSRAGSSLCVVRTSSCWAKWYVFSVSGCVMILIRLLQDLDREDDIPETVTKAPFEEVFELKKKEDSERKRGDKKRQTELQALGFEPEHSGEILF